MERRPCCACIDLRVRPYCSAQHFYDAHFTQVLPSWSGANASRDNTVKQTHLELRDRKLTEYLENREPQRRVRQRTKKDTVKTKNPTAAAAA